MAEAVPAENRGRGRPHTINNDENPSSADAELLTTASGKRIKVTDREFAIMLEKAGGFKSRVAKQLGITVSAVCHRIARSEYLREACKTIEETILDLAEASLVKAAQNGEAWAITFILKCKGRKRGWIERSDLVFSGELDAPPPPFVLAFHDPAYVEAEKARTDMALADVVEAEVVELTAGAEKDEAKGEDGQKAPAKAKTSGGTGPSLDIETDTWTDYPAPTGDDSALIGGVTPPGAAVGDPQGAEAQSPAPRHEAPKGAGNAPQEQPKPEPPRAPRTPSEAAAMRRAEEERRRAEQGGDQPQAPARPAFVAPVAFPRR